MADEAELRIYSEIGPAWMGMVDDVSVIRALDEIKSRRISLRLNSPGGDVFMGVSIMNALRRHAAKITVHVDALAASAASLIAMGADKIVMHEGSMLMIHRAWTLAMGNSSDFAQIAETLAKVDSNIVDIYHRRSGLDKAKVKQLVDAESWFGAQEAVDLGLADEVDLIATGAQAKLPEGWYAHAPKSLGRYSLPERRTAASLTGLTIAASVPNKDIQARRACLDRHKQRLHGAGINA